MLSELIVLLDGMCGVWHTGARTFLDEPSPPCGIDRSFWTYGDIDCVPEIPANFPRKEVYPVVFPLQLRYLPTTQSYVWEPIPARED